jgi:hypothetical protein
MPRALTSWAIGQDMAPVHAIGLQLGKVGRLVHCRSCRHRRARLASTPQSIDPLFTGRPHISRRSSCRSSPLKALIMVGSASDSKVSWRPVYPWTSSLVYSIRRSCRSN